MSIGLLLGKYGGGRRRALPEPILAGAIHHWSSTQWTEAAGNVTAVQDQIGTATFTPNAGTVAKTTFGSQSLPAWDTDPGFLETGTIPSFTLDQGAALILYEFVSGSVYLSSWGPAVPGNGNYIFASATNITLILGNAAAINVTGLSAGPHVLLATWDLTLPSGNRKARIWTEAGLALGSDTLSNTASPTTRIASGAVIGGGQGRYKIPDHRLGNAFVDAPEAAATVAAFAAFWGV